MIEFKKKKNKIFDMVENFFIRKKKVMKKI